MTPRWEQPSGLTSPAWNPLSSDDDLEPFTPIAKKRVAASTHVLLDQRLLGIPLRVVVSGGEYSEKEMTVHVQNHSSPDSDALVIGRRKHKSWFPLSPDWISPKHPNPTRDNGLLVVIGGDHFGKCVRRIHHCHRDGGTIILLAVVDRVPGRADRLTGEKIELDRFHLCVCEEATEDKKRNESLMTALRDEARQTHAK